MSLRNHIILALAVLTILACNAPGAAAPTGPAIRPSPMSTEAPTSTAEPVTATAIPPTEPPAATPTLESAPTSSVPGRHTTDQPDEAEGYQVHVMYVLPSDGTDRALDTDGTLANSVGSFENWLAAQSGGTRVRLDTTGGAPDITFYRLPRADATIAGFGVYVRDEVQADLIAAGFNQPHKLYAVYYDGTSDTSCGAGAWPPELVGEAAMLYLRGLPTGPVPCLDNPFAPSPDATPGYLEFSMLHEIFHTIGAVAECAPNQVLRGHVRDGNNDLMYAGPLPWQPDTLDNGRDDYWGHSNSGCLDASKSVFMDPLPADAQTPPGW